jgi:hypothetical protein
METEPSTTLRNGCVGAVDRQLVQPVPLRSPALAFALTLVTGPVGFFYISWRLGLMALLACGISCGVHFGLTLAGQAGWPGQTPTLEINESGASLLKWCSWAFQGAILGSCAAFLTSSRNDAIQAGNAADFERFRSSKDCLDRVALLYGLLLAAFWALNDLMVGIGSLLQSHFVMGIIHICMLPHAVVAGIIYGTAILIARALMR